QPPVNDNLPALQVFTGGAYAMELCFVPVGACCSTNGTCLQFVSQSQCDAQNGVFHGGGSNCRDQDGDLIADVCDNCPSVANSSQADADTDGVGDTCDNCPLLPNPGQADCDNDGKGDACAIAEGISTDCNANGIPDECDISAGTSQDCNADGVPDECESPLTLCDDGIDCTTDSCDEANQSCLHVPDAAVCDDGNACNGLETCDPASGCRPGDPLICDDGLFCNGVEICDPILGCLDQADPCDETQICYEDKDDCFDNIIPTVSEWGLVGSVTVSAEPFFRLGEAQECSHGCSAAEPVE
ncbi:MAG: thrombospondin type 3 repeat-containing protein, partial [Phycisphaerales bacterium]|nr:thrombospondin type 3 repeat-containing protein [Phycisphaerales bacterium]